MSTDQPSKKSVHWAVSAVIATVLAIAIGVGYKKYRYQHNEKRLAECLENKAYDRCLEIGQAIHEKKHDNVRINGYLMKAIRAKLKDKELAWSIAFLEKTRKTFPKLAELENDLVYLRLAAIEQLFLIDPVTALLDANALAAQYVDQAKVQLAVGKLYLRTKPSSLQQSLYFFGKALKQSAALKKETIISETVLIALSTLRASQTGTAFAIANEYFLDDLAPTLEQNLQNHDNAILRNNAFRLLQQANRVTDEQIFVHHWQNLLDGRREVEEAYRAAVSFFKEQQNDSAKFDKKLIQFKHFPLLDQVADQYTKTTLSVLMEVLPKETKQHLKKNLKDTKRDWPRTNSFYALKERNLISAIEILRYHSRNLSLKRYDYFTDWLADSIDYYSRRGSSGKAKLRKFVGRIVSLKKRSNKEKRRIYQQIESYTRTKIGKRN